MSQQAHPQSDVPPDVLPVVTIFEEYGAGAEEVGHRVATALGLPFHARAFSSEAIEGEDAPQREQNAVLAQVSSAMGGAYGGVEGRAVVTTQQQKDDLAMDNDRRTAYGPRPAVGLGGGPGGSCAPTARLPQRR